MDFFPFHYSPAASPVSTPCRLSFIPRPRLVPKSFNVTDYPSQPPAIFADAVTIPFAGILTLPSKKKERKAAEAEAQRLEAELELKANGGKPDLAEKERVAITELCRSLNVEMKEVRGKPLNFLLEVASLFPMLTTLLSRLLASKITPDGHW
jgi:hypothetical protein